MMRDFLATFVFMFEMASALDGLNKEQRQAATHDGGPLLTVAEVVRGGSRESTPVSICSGPTDERAPHDDERAPHDSAQLSSISHTCSRCGAPAAPGAVRSKLMRAARPWNSSAHSMLSNQVPSTRWRGPLGGQMTLQPLRGGPRYRVRAYSASPLSPADCPGTSAS